MAGGLDVAATETSIDTSLVLSWAIEAGDIALSYFGDVAAQLKPDDTLVTTADREIEAHLLRRIRDSYPRHGVVGEEGGRAGGTETLWAVDPIDGTRAFTLGLPGWCISIGVLIRGQPCWGLIYMPLLDDWMVTDGAADVVWNGHTLHDPLRSEWYDHSYLAISSTVHSFYRICVRCTRALGSIAANMSYTARGSSLGAFVEQAFIWDLAAGAAILGRLGAEIRYLSGRPIDWVELYGGQQIPEPILTTHPALFARLREQIHER
jgi:myo-inositol-1(or 4)-monophosphatase